MSEVPGLREKFETALNQLLEKLKKDPNILAVYVYGSYVHGDIGKLSDLDTIIITNDDKNPHDFAILNENDVCFHADLYSRIEFRKQQQSFMHGGFLHHMLSTSKLVYSNDESITEIGRDTIRIAERDKELQVLRYSEWALGCFLKAQKTYILQDVEKSLLWFPRLTQLLAHVLLLLNDQIPGRDVLAQAKELDNTLLNEIISKTYKEAFSKSNLDYVLKLVEDFLLENRYQLFSPIFTYFKETSDARSITEIGDHFLREFGRPSTDPPWELALALEWLAYHGDLMKASAPRRLTSKSRITADEAAYYWMGSN